MTGVIKLKNGMCSLKLNFNTLGIGEFLVHALDCGYLLDSFFVGYVGHCCCVCCSWQFHRWKCWALREVLELRRQLGAVEDKKMAAKLMLVKRHIGEPARWDPGR